MNILKGTRCYLSGHMQYLDGQNWRLNITPILMSMGIKVFDPYHNPFISAIKEDKDTRSVLLSQMEKGEYDKVAEHMLKIRAEDLRLCDISDFSIVNIRPEIASWGTAEEIVTLCRMKKPTFIVIEGGKSKTPLWLMGMIPHKYFYNSIDEVVEIVKSIDSGEKKADSSRWRLLQQQYR